MPLRHEPDVSHADWFASEVVDFRQVCSIGPSGFAAYARVLHPTEPPHGAQELLSVEGDLPDDQLEALCGVLARHTATPDDCFFGLWEGHGEIHDSVHFVSAPAPKRPRRERPAVPAFGKAVLEGPTVRIPGRDFLLFRGPLTRAGDWGAAANPWRDHPQWPRERRINSPNLIWPADRAWFVASEIDLPWTGVGGSAALVRELPAAGVLDVVRAVASPDLPYAREGSRHRPG